MARRTLSRARFDTDSFSLRPRSVALLKSATKPLANHLHVTKPTSSIGLSEEAAFQRQIGGDFAPFGRLAYA